MQENSTTVIKIVIISLMLFFQTANAQFYTIRPRESVVAKKNVETDKTPHIIKENEEKPSLSRIKSNKRTSLEASLPICEPMFITSPYGYRVDPFTGKKRFHRGIDLRCDNAKVIAMFNGKVKKIGYQKKGLGHYLVLSHPPFEITYAHLEYTLVEKGANVSAGEVVAVSGSTGRSTGPHLHIELKYKGSRCNPLPLLAFLEKSIRTENKIRPTIMQKENEMLTALDHVQEAYADEFLAFLKEEKLEVSEESAIRFLERVEQDIIQS